MIETVGNGQVRCISQYGANASMGILHVVDRIFIGATSQNINIHDHRSIDGVANQGVARSIDAHFLHQLFQSNYRSGALREFELFATFHDLD